MIPLTLTHLRFVVEAITPIRLGEYRAGSRLRGALGNVMRRAYCVAYPPHQSRSNAVMTGDPSHASTCPVCWLLAADEHPGEERRGYALVPPARPPECYAPGDRFSFGITLFGNARRFLPYFVLAVPEMGQLGVGPGRGHFALRQVWAADPLTGEFQCLLREGDSLVHTPTLTITADQVWRTASDLQRAMSVNQRLTLSFITPLRLIHEGRLVKAPDFAVLFARLLERIDQLNTQFCGGSRRGPEEARALHALADRVRLVEANTRWIEISSGSSRTRRETPMSGFVGRATYSAPPEVWMPLLPWLIWGQGTQLGKDVVKGNGCYDVVVPGLPRYTEWVSRPVPVEGRVSMPGGE